MRYIDKSAVHAKAVEYGRSRSGMKRTANRLAACNVDKMVDDMVERIKPAAWELDDAALIDGLARRLWLDFCMAEVNLLRSAKS